MSGVVVRLGNGSGVGVIEFAGYGDLQRGGYGVFFPWVLWSLCVSPPAEQVSDVCDDLGVVVGAGAVQ